MAKYDDDIFAKLKDIAKRHSDCTNDYDEIISLCPKKLMSRGVELYGMFYPENEISKYIIYKGKLTTNEKKRNYSYFFDENDKLRLTERYDGSGVLMNLIFYYYYEDLVEIVWYDLKRAIVHIVGFIDYKNGILSRFVQSFDFRIGGPEKGIKTYREYVFDADEEFVLDRSYDTGLFGDGEVRENISKMRKR